MRVATKKTATTTYRYLQLCEAVRVNGRPTDRVLCNVGNLDRIPKTTLTALLDSLSALAGDGLVRAAVGGH